MHWYSVKRVHDRQSVYWEQSCQKEMCTMTCNSILVVKTSIILISQFLGGCKFRRLKARAIMVTSYKFHWNPQKRSLEICSNPEHCLINIQTFEALPYLLHQPRQFCLESCKLLYRPVQYRSLRICILRSPKKDCLYRDLKAQPLTLNYKSENSLLQNASNN